MSNRNFGAMIHEWNEWEKARKQLELLERVESPESRQKWIHVIEVQQRRLFHEMIAYAHETDSTVI